MIICNTSDYGQMMFGRNAKTHCKLQHDELMRQTKTKQWLLAWIVQLQLINGSVQCIHRAHKGTEITKAVALHLAKICVS